MKIRRNCFATPDVKTDFITYPTKKKTMRNMSLKKHLKPIMILHKISLNKTFIELIPK